MCSEGLSARRSGLSSGSSGQAMGTFGKRPRQRPLGTLTPLERSCTSRAPSESSHSSGRTRLAQPSATLAAKRGHSSKKPMPNPPESCMYPPCPSERPTVFTVLPRFSCRSRNPPRPRPPPRPRRRRPSRSVAASSRRRGVPSGVSSARPRAPSWRIASTSGYRGSLARSSRAASPANLTSGGTVVISRSICPAFPLQG